MKEDQKAAYPPLPREVEIEAEEAAMAEHDRALEIPYGAPPGSLRWPWRAAAQVAWRQGYLAGYHAAVNSDG